METDHIRMRKYLDEIARETADLESILYRSDSDILASVHLLKSCKYSIIVITEAMGGLLQHLLAKQYRVSVTGYNATLSKAGQYKILSAELLGRLMPFVRFRNMLVHHYWAVDDAVFLENLRDGLNDFHALISEIQALPES